MTQIVSFTFNAFQENTYVVYDETKDCCIIDPGCYEQNEKDELVKFIEDQKLNPVLLLNTHCHIDHVFGNRFISQRYKLPLHIHEIDRVVLDSYRQVCDMYGFGYEPQPEPQADLIEGRKISFGNTEFEILFTPGHSPGSVCFLNREEKFVVSGDVLFYDSIGRHDLPGGNLETLMNSIFSQLMILEDEVTVYSGHGPKTTIGRERNKNPFLLAWEKGDRDWI